MDNPLGIHNPANIENPPEGMRFLRRGEPRGRARKWSCKHFPVGKWEDVEPWALPEAPIGFLKVGTYVTDAPLIMGNKVIDTPATGVSVPLSIPPPGFMSETEVRQKIEAELPALVENPEPPCDKIDAVLDERHKTHGKFTDNAAVSQGLKRVIAQASINREEPIDDDMTEALDLVCTKIGRMLTGDINNPEHWLDGSGYFKLVHDRLTGNAR